MNKKKGHLREVVLLFLKLGFLSYGGPAAHTALMQEEIVTKRKWVTEERFLDLLSASHLIPGPNSTELAIQLSYERAGWAGLLLGGSAFILPAFLFVFVLARLYATYNDLSFLPSILAGMQAVIFAIILQALLNLGKSALKRPVLYGVLVLALIARYFGISEIAILAICAALTWLMKKATSLRSVALPSLLLSAGSIGISELFLRFFKIGALLYGSGYVLIAYLQSELVETGYLSSAQLLDAVTIGQLTPGPLFTTATFVGYQLAGAWGAVVATLGIFLPSFLLVALLVKITDKLRKSSTLSLLLDGINIGSLALMGYTSVLFTKSVFTNPLTIGMTAVAFVLLRTKKVDALWLIAAGALLGYFFL